MLLTSMLYHIVFGREYCLTVVASVICAVNVHHVVDMCVFIICYEITVVTFDYLFIHSFVLLDMLPEMLV